MLELRVFLNGVEELWNTPQVWFGVIAGVSALFTFLAFRLRNCNSPSIQGVLIVAALWLIWLPLATGGELFLVTAIGGPYRVLPVIGSYLSLGAALVCARVAMSLPKAALTIVALMQVSLIAAILGLEVWLIGGRWLQR